MREWLFKNKTSPNMRRRVVSASETLKQDGLEIVTLRRCAYQVRQRIHISQLDYAAQHDIPADGTKPPKPHACVLRKHDAVTGDKISCKVRGIFYVVVGEYLYMIAFSNLLKLSMRPCLPCQT